MADAVKPRPVSGEIMASTPAVRAGVPAGADVIDAEFETLAGAATFAAGPAPAKAEQARGMDMLRRNTVPKQARQRGGLLFWASGLTLAACAFWLSGGHALVHGNGQPAFGSASALRIVDVTSSVGGSPARPMLNVDGAAVNEGSMAAILPGIEIKVVGKGGRVTRYNLGTSERPLQAGQRFAFSSWLEVPKDGVRTVAVSFRAASFREDSVYAGGERQGY